MSDCAAEEGTVTYQLHMWSTEDPERPAFIFRGSQPGNSRVVLTRQDVFLLSGCFAHQVEDAGIKRGDTVCNTLPSSPERLITDLGCLMAGATVLNGPVYLASGEDLFKAVVRSGCVAIVMEYSDTHGNAMTVLGDRVIVRGINAQSRDAPSLKKVFNVDCGGGASLRPWLEHLKQRWEVFESPVTPEDRAYIFSSAGTSAFSRLVPRTHGHLLHAGTALHDLLGMDQDDVYFNANALGCYYGAWLVYVAKGNTRVLLDMTVPHKQPASFAWACCQEEECTVAFIHAHDISDILSEPSDFRANWRRLRSILTGRVPVSKHQVRAVGLLCDSLVISYVTAEAGFVTSLRVDEGSREQFADGDCGTVLSGNHLQIVDKQGHEIHVKDAGKPGSMLLRSHELFMGYLGSDSKPVFTDDGWVRSGDVAFYDAMGHVHILCRTDNGILYGPVVVNPVWLEEKLKRCHGVKHAVIVPVPDPAMYQEMCACIVAKHGVLLKESEVRAHCSTLYADAPSQSQLIPRYFLFMHDVPMVTADLPDRKKVYALALDKLRI